MDMYKVENWSKHDTLMVNGLNNFPENLETTLLNVSQFRSYFTQFQGRPIQDIVEALRRYGDSGYFQYEIRLDPEYLNHGKALEAVKTALNSLGSGTTESNKLRGLSKRVYAKVVSQGQLNMAEVSTLPEAAKPYLLFKISNLDRERVRKELAMYNDNSFVYPSRLEKIKVNKLEPSDSSKLTIRLKVDVKSYDPVNKTLNFGKPIRILTQTRTTKASKETAECRLMRMMFKNVKTLKRGLNMTSFIPSKNGILDPKDKKKIYNYVAQINKKVKEAVGIDHLIICDGNKVKVDKSYL